MVYAETLLQERVRHNRSLEITDLVLVCYGVHTMFVPVCVFHGDSFAHYIDGSF